VKADWIRFVRDLCQEHETSFFFKQWGGTRSKSGGRLLDGREWNDMPDHALEPVLAPTGPKIPRARQRDIPDDADEKWTYPEHTAAKHEILRRYLGAWLSILGRGKRGFRHSQLVLLDGFAGRGRYLEGQAGSPAIMFERAKQVAEDGLVEKVLIRCSEPNKINFGHLKDVSDALVHPKVKVHATQETFEDVAARFVTWVAGETAPPPTFVMVDPYGVHGVRLETLRRLLSFDRVEVLLTFMVREPSRFLKEANYEEPLTALFGGDSWKACEHADDRPECLMRRFREVVTPTVARYATPFKVYEDQRKVPLYYLVHLTNNDLGMREMTEAMAEKSGDMTFFPITLRPLDQLGLDVAEKAPYPALQAWLTKKYAGRQLKFVDLLNDDYPEGHGWVEKHYRGAIKAMEMTAPSLAKIGRLKPTTKTGRPAKSLTYQDTVRFMDKS
jgi:three-Cys-motif partner protein